VVICAFSSLSKWEDEVETIIVPGYSELKSLQSSISKEKQLDMVVCAPVIPVMTGSIK
jgi:6,7-dimethyl-8-ribityllumazine synthase